MLSILSELPKLVKSIKFCFFPKLSVMTFLEKVAVLVKLSELTFLPKYKFL